MTASNASTATAPSPKSYVMAIAPYVPGRSTTDDGRTVVKLSSNENPLGTSPAARAAFVAASTTLERYPDAGATICATRSRGRTSSIRRGSSTATARTRCSTSPRAPSRVQGDEVIFVRYGFAVYEIAARRVGAVPVVAPDSDYATDVDAVLACVTDRTRIVYIANPNNPTGTFTPREEIARLHAGLRPDILLVLDQAYAEYLDPADDDGGMALAKTASNVLVTRTFSKIHGLAAERIGWGYASAAIIQAMHRIRLPFSITIAGQHAAVAALGDTGFVAHTRDHNATWRAWFADEIAKLGNAGLRPIPSEANFVLVLFEGALTAEAAYHGLMDSGLYRPLAARAGAAARAADHDRHRGGDARGRRGAPRPGRRRPDAAVRARHGDRPGADRLVDRARGAGIRCRPCGSPATTPIPTSARSRIGSAWPTISPTMPARR